MEPTSSPDNTRPSPGLARFWQVRPEPVVPEPAEPLETPADLLNGSLLGTFRSRPIPPLAPIASAARHPVGADPFGLSRAAVPVPRTVPQQHGDPDHSEPSEDRADPDEDVKSQEPEGGFSLGGRPGRALFGDQPTGTPAVEQGPRAGEEPAGVDPTGAAQADEPAVNDPPETGQDAAEVAATTDENGREDMNGRAGAPGYAQTGEAGPDGTDPAEETTGPADQSHPAAGWASVPGASQQVIPTSGAPVSPAYAPNPYSVADFTPDHPANTLQPVSAQPEERPQAPAGEPEDPAVSAPVSPATGQAQVQIPATRTPPDAEHDGYPGLPPSAEGGYGFSPAGYSLGRPPEAFGVASVASAPPADFPSFAPAAEPLILDVPPRPDSSGARRSASLEDAEPVRRGARRAAPAQDPAPADEEPVIGRTVWDDDAARHFRAAWHEVKAEFVDDPERALTRAHDLLTDAVNELTEVLLAERDELDPLRGTGTPDTESMRMAMRGYREFLERILSL